MFGPISTSVVQIFKTVVGVAAIGFVPGYLLQRRAMASIDGRGSRFTPLERGFLGVSFSLALSSIVALFLAQIGQFSVDLLVGLLLVGSTLTWLSLRVGRSGHHALRRRARARWGSSELLAALLVLCSVGIFFPPYQTTLWASDSTLYIGSGVEISRTGAYLATDEILQEMSPIARRELFRNRLAGDDTGEFARFPGGISIADIETGRVAAGFAPLLPVWVAIFHGLFGLPAAFGVSSFFGVLAVLAVFLVGRSMQDDQTGFVAALLLASSLPQIWFARFPMAEIPTQFFVFSGLWVLLWFVDTQERFLSAGAGLLMGTALLVRFDVLPVVGVAAAAFIAISIQASRPRRRPGSVVEKASGNRSSDPALAAGSRPFFVIFGAAAAYCLAHLILLPTNYSTFLADLLERRAMGEAIGWALTAVGSSPAVWLVGGLVGLAIVAARWLGVKFPPGRESGVAVDHRRGGAPAAGTGREIGDRLRGARSRFGWVAWSLWAAIMVYAAIYFATSRFRLHETVAWLGAYLSWPVLVICALSLVGLATGSVFRDAGRKKALLLTLLLGASILYLYNPQEFGVHIWTMRRFVPVIIPGALLVVAGGIVSSVRWLLAAAERRMVSGDDEVRPESARETTTLPQTGRVALWSGVAGALLLALYLVGRPSLPVFAQTYWQDGVRESDELAALFAADAVVLIGPELAGTHAPATLTYLYGRAGILLQDSYPPSPILRDQIVRWLDGGRAVYLLVARGAVHFGAPDLNLTREGSDTIELTVLESTEDPPPRRPAQRSIAVTAYRAHLSEPGQPKNRIDVGTYAEDALVVLRGFHSPEEDAASESSFRWTTGTASIEIPRSATLALHVAGGRPESVPPARLSVWIDDTIVMEGRIVRNAPTRLDIDVPLAASPEPMLVTIRTTTFVPRQQGLSDDDRTLGVKLYGIEVSG